MLIQKIVTHLVDGSCTYDVRLEHDDELLQLPTISEDHATQLFKKLVDAINLHTVTRVNQTSDIHIWH